MRQRQVIQRQCPPDDFNQRSRFTSSLEILDHFFRTWRQIEV